MEMPTLLPAFLIVRLDGPMQAWGSHTFEDYRPSGLFPTRSGLLGLIGACLGIDRGDQDRLDRLASSLTFTLRVDQCPLRPELESNRPQPMRKPTKSTDFHTVLNARKVDGSANRNPVVSRREYLFDALFTLAIGQRTDAEYDLTSIAAALRRPRFTPVLGRRSCPIARPLLDGDSPIEADNAVAALATIPPTGGPIYAEGDYDSGQLIQIRDVPSYGRIRRFGTRRLYLITSQGTDPGVQE
jgi:CRISPR system Cascade subunit CasD